MPLFFLILTLFACNLALNSPSYGAEQQIIKTAGKKKSGPPVNQARAVAIGKEIVRRLAKGKFIAASWEIPRVESAKKREYPHGIEWVIAFFNKREKDKSKQNLYIFLTLDGKYIAVNYTGH